MKLLYFIKYLFLQQYRRSQKAARDCILSTLSKPAENNSFLQTHTKKRKRATNSVLLPLNFDINDIYNNNNDFEEEYIVEENEHNINQNINKNKNIKKEETNKTKISTKTSFKNKLVSTTTSNITNSQHSNLTTATTINSTSSPFVLASICGLSFTFIKKDLQQQKLNKINVGFDSINLKDLFEKTTTTTNDESLLLRIGKEKKLKSDKNGPDGTFRSLSCPDLTTNSSKHANNISINETIETSDSINLISNLPSTSLLEENLIVIEKENVGRHQTMPTIKQQIDNNIPNIKQNPKKNHSVEIVFIPNIQEGFETKYKKANCIVTGNFDEQTDVELFINRRTWLLFMDFFGFCSSSDINKNVLNNNNYIMRVELNVSNLILSMNYPKSEFTPKLGIVYIQKPKFITQINLNVLSDPILIWMQAHSFSLTDENGLFSQRLRVGNFDKSNGKSPPCIQLKLVKNRRSMTSLPNEFDIHLTLNVDSNIVNYIHSHRYYYALLDFWLQFAELYDRLCIENEMQKQKPSQKNSQDANNLLKLRCKLDIDFTSGFRLYLPSSERSSLAVLFECDKVNISNQFCRASQIKNLLQKHLGKQQFNASNGSSLLLDDINIKIQHFSIYYGNFCVAKNIRSKNGRTSTKDDFTAYTFHKLQSAIGSDIDGNTNHNMEMQIYRNLSVRASHAGGFIFIIL
uniref:SHR-BD domain-containing protein n=1 Tax=Meloidogyne hapla TaxID=6305 RepID=A0A1I8BYP9_MELHA